MEKVAGFDIISSNFEFGDDVDYGYFIAMG